MIETLLIVTAAICIIHYKDKPDFSIKLVIVASEYAEIYILIAYAKISPKDGVIVSK